MLNPLTNFANAIAAYNRAGTLAGDVGAGPHAPATASTGDFTGLVKGAIANAIDIGESGERMSIAAVADRADLTQVVTAVSEAESVLNAVVAIRDRVVEAYKDIMRMPI